MKVLNPWKNRCQNITYPKNTGNKGFVDLSFEPDVRLSATFALFRLPFLPETIGLFGLAVSGPDVRLHIEGVQPADMVRAPADKTVKRGIRFIIGAHRNTDGAWRMTPAPVHPACLRVDRPLQCTTHIGNIIGL